MNTCNRDHHNRIFDDKSPITVQKIDENLEILKNKMSF